MKPNKKKEKKEPIEIKKDKEDQNERKSQSKNYAHLQYYFLYGLLVKNGFTIRMSTPKKVSSKTFDIFDLYEIITPDGRKIEFEREGNE